MTRYRKQIPDTRNVMKRREWFEIKTPRAIHFHSTRSDSLKATNLLACVGGVATAFSPFVYVRGTAYFYSFETVYRNRAGRCYMVLLPDILMKTPVHLPIFHRDLLFLSRYGQIRIPKFLGRTGLHHQRPENVSKRCCGSICRCFLQSS